MKAALWNLLQNNIHPFLLLFCFLSPSVISGATEWGQNFLTFIVIIKIFDDGYVSSRSAVSNDSLLHFLFISFGFGATKKQVVEAGPYPMSTAAWGAQKNCLDFYVCSLFLANTLATKNYNLSLDFGKKDTLLELWEF